MNKRGQFYFIAAIILVAVIIGISAVSNYSKQEDTPGIYELRDEIKIESMKAIDYGTENGFTQTQMNSLLQDFSTEYQNYEGTSDKSIYFIFGNEDNVTISGKQKKSKTITISSGTAGALVTEQSGNFYGNIDPGDNEISVIIDGTDYVFPLTGGENFYFIITQEFGGGEYVVKG